MKRTITVLQDDIDNGRCFEAYKCAIALAAQRDLADLVPENGCMGVGTNALTLYRQRQTHVGHLFAGLAMFMSADLPAEARDFIRYFDHLDTKNCACGMPLPQPFKFEIDLKPFAESAQGETQQ